METKWSQSLFEPFATTRRSLSIAPRCKDRGVGEEITIYIRSLHERTKRPGQRYYFRDTNLPQLFCIISSSVELAAQDVTKGKLTPTSSPLWIDDGSNQSATENTRSSVHPQRTPNRAVHQKSSIWIKVYSWPAAQIGQLEFDWCLFKDEKYFQ